MASALATESAAAPGIAWRQSSQESPRTCAVQLTAPSGVGEERHFVDGVDFFHSSRVSLIEVAVAADDVPVTDARRSIFSRRLAVIGGSGWLVPLDLEKLAVACMARTSNRQDGYNRSRNSCGYETGGLSRIDVLDD